MTSCFRFSSWRVVLVVIFALGAVEIAAAAPDQRLAQAAKAGDAEAIRTLLQSRVDVNASMPDGSTALHWAAYHDDLAMAEALLRSGARADVANDLGATPLHLACINRNAAMVERLLAAGADASAALVNGETVLMTCSRTGNAAAVKALLRRGGEVNARERAHDQTALMWAAAQRHSDIVRLLVEAGADPNARSKIYSEVVAPYETQRAGREELSYTVRAGGLTPLFFAARSGDSASARLLVAAGADPNAHLPDGTTPLIMAAYSARDDCGVALLESGADPNDSAAGYAPLHAAILRGQIDLVKALLAHGADANARIAKSIPKRRRGEDFVIAGPLIGSTPYLLAARFLEPEILAALKSGGADLAMTMPDGATALMLAVGMDSVPTESRRGVRSVDFGKPEPESQVMETVEAVLGLGTDLNATNSRGDSALHAAAVLMHDAVVQYLINQGAEVNVKNARGQTPLGALLAAQKGRRPVAADGDDVEAGGDPAKTATLLRKLGGNE